MTIQFRNTSERTVGSIATGTLVFHRNALWICMGDTLFVCLHGGPDDEAGDHDEWGSTVRVTPVTLVDAVIQER